jgi:hypothetical protein
LGQPICPDQFHLCHLINSHLDEEFAAIVVLDEEFAALVVLDEVVAALVAHLFWTNSATDLGQPIWTNQFGPTNLDQPIWAKQLFCANQFHLCHTIKSSSDSFWCHLPDQ